MKHQQYYWRPVNDDQFLYFDAQWQSLLKRSEAKDKKYPKWVKRTFSDIELENGFMKNGIFYKPLFLVSMLKSGHRIANVMPMSYSYSVASAMIDDFEKNPKHKDTIFELILAGFKGYARSEVASK